MTTQAHTYKQNEALQVPNTLPANGGVSDAEKQAMRDAFEARFPKSPEFLRTEDGYVEKKLSAWSARDYNTKYSLWKAAWQASAQFRQPSAQGGERGWRFTRYDHIKIIVVTRPDGKETELRQSELGSVAAAELFSEMARALAPPPAGGGKEALSEAERASYALVEAAKQADCSCSVLERESGHRLGCWMPELQDAIDAAKKG